VEERWGLTKLRVYEPTSLEIISMDSKIGLLKIHTMSNLTRMS